MALPLEEIEKIRNEAKIIEELQRFFSLETISDLINIDKKEIEKINNE